MRTLLLLLMMIFISGCSAVTVGNSFSEYKILEGVKIQPERAVELAGPYLDKSFHLRTKNRPPRMLSDRKPYINVMLKGNYYYVVKDNYPAIPTSFYLPHAVKVHKQSGEVIEPN